MTVSTEVNQAAYTGNGVTTVFPYTFRILNASNLTVTRIDLQEVETLLTLGTDYTVTGAGSYNGGAVVLPQPLQNNYSLVIVRDLAAVQETDLRNQGTFFAEVHEDVFDYLTMLIQQVTSWLGLALRRPTVKSKFYDAKQYRIANLSDPANDQDAVNNRSMRSYVDQMIAGVVGGFGWFIQAGSGAIYRTFQSKMRESVSILDFGGVANNASVNNSSALAAAALAAGEGGTVNFPAGSYRFVGATSITPVNIVGDGQGGTFLEFDNTIGQFDAIIFIPPTKTDIEFGAQNISVKAVGGNGNNAFYTPRGIGLNGLRPKPTFKHISFFSENTNAVNEGFSQKYGWLWAFNCGDSWQFTIERVDAVGCYQASINYTSQFLDGFIRTDPTEGILSMRVVNITTHNVANFFEIRRKTYFALTGIDCARALRGVYDAPDRIFETNRYAYGESIWTNVVINAQLNPVKLDNRFLLIANGLAIHRAANGFNHGQDWNGLELTRPRVCTFQGLEIGTASGYTGTKRGLVIDAGDANNFINVSFGLLDVGAQVGKTGTAYGANQASNFNNVSINANQNILFDLQTCRNFHCDGFGKSSAYTLTQFLNVGVDSSNTYTFSNIDNFAQYTDNSFYWNNSAAALNEKRWRWDTSAGLSLSTQTDVGAIGNNAIIVARSGVLIDHVELRANSSTGYVLLSGANVQSGNHFKPTTDNAFTNGTAALRWSTIYAGTGSINTSDGDLKEEVLEINETERRVALKLKALLRRFKFKESCAEKGADGARLHFGIIAQDLAQAFRDEGLDPEKYAMFCHDEWSDEYKEETEKFIIHKTNEDTGDEWDEEVERKTGKMVLSTPAGNRYGVRYEELMCFIISAL